MFNKKICIDLGTANTIVYSSENGIVFEEPTVLAMDTKTKEVIAIGVEAKSMLGKVSEDITACRPLQHGVIASFKITEKYLQYCLSPANPVITAIRKKKPSRKLYRQKRISKKWQQRKVLLRHSGILQIPML